jgi:hypothetical protein
VAEASGAEEPNPERIEHLLRELLLAIKDHYRSGDVSRSQVFEVLNALALAASVVVQGAGGKDGLAAKFFSEAFRIALIECPITQDEKS